MIVSWPGCFLNERWDSSGRIGFQLRAGLPSNPSKAVNRNWSSGPAFRSFTGAAARNATIPTATSAAIAFREMYMDNLQCSKKHQDRTTHANSFAALKRWEFSSPCRHSLRFRRQREQDVGVRDREDINVNGCIPLALLLDAEDTLQ